MFRCSRAVPTPPFRPRPYGCAALPDPPPSCPSRRPSGLRPRRPGPWTALLASGVAGTGLAACADSVWEPPTGGAGAEDGRPMAALVSETALGASPDAAEPPPWLEAIRSMESEGCVIHFRRADGTYASITYRLRYSRGAMARDGRWRALVYRVRGTVTRPAEGGGTETLPERLGVRAACHLPDTERGLEEARGPRRGHPRGARDPGLRPEGRGLRRGVGGRGLRLGGPGAGGAPVVGTPAVGGRSAKMLLLSSVDVRRGGVPRCRRLATAATRP